MSAAGDTTTPAGTTTRAGRHAGGRPRDPRVDEAVREATVAILVADGYAPLTVDAVARRAGVGVASIYRRWPSKAHLVHEVVFPDTLRLTLPPDVRFEDAVRALVAGAVVGLSRPEAQAAIPGLRTDCQADPELHRRLMARFEDEARAMLRDAAALAVARGEIRPDLDVDVLFDAVIGSVVAATAGTGRPGGRDLADALTDLFLDGARVRGGGSGRAAGDAPGGPTGEGQ